MALEQMTTDVDVEDDDQTPDEKLPKGMVRNEMGKLVPKAKLEADEAQFSRAMTEQAKNRVKDAAKYRAMMRLKAMKKK